MHVTFVKGCRVRDFGTIQRMAELGYEFVGVHAITSLEIPRLAEIARLARLTTEHNLPIKPVLLTKVVDVAHVVRALDYTGIDWLQLHHPWPMRDLLVLRNELLRRRSSVTIILLIDPTSALDSCAVNEYLNLVDFAILDHRAGGTGRLLASDAIQRALDTIDPNRVFIAGGLDACNVVEIVRRHRPYAVDVQSGLLNSAGNHDPVKLAAFIHAVRSVRHSTTYPEKGSP